jgi:3-hydroxymyristoyl/3-hydroxydecanoyl-(acyl carrier protein) dehydratase
MPSSDATALASAGLLPMATHPSDGDRVFRFRVSPESRCFDGHFAGLPILPGVGHLAMVASACALRSRQDLVLAGARDLRFQRPLGPGDEVEVALDDGVEAFSVRFEVRCRGEVASRGLLLFEPPTDDGRP